MSNNKNDDDLSQDIDSIIDKYKESKDPINELFKKVKCDHCWDKGEVSHHNPYVGTTYIKCPYCPTVAQTKPNSHKQLSGKATLNKKKKKKSKKKSNVPSFAHGYVKVPANVDEIIAKRKVMEAKLAQEKKLKEEADKRKKEQFILDMQKREMEQNYEYMIKQLDVLRKALYPNSK